MPSKTPETFTGLIKNAKVLDKAIVTGLGFYTKAHDILHVAAVSAIWQMAVHAQPGPLQRLYDGLKVNDQQALQLFIRRAHIIIGLGGKNPDGLDSETIKAAEKAGQVISRKDKKFAVRRNPSTPEAKALAEMCETRFIVPVDPDKKVFDRNNLNEVRLMGDDAFLDKLIRAGKEIEEGSDDRRTIAVSDPVKKLILDSAAKAGYLKNQLSLATSTAVN